MKKWIWVSVVAVVILVGLVVLTVANLGPIVRAAVNTAGPKITQTKVHVDNVGLSLLSGHVDLKGLVVGNPKGFSAPDAIKLGSAAISLDRKSLGSNTVVINKIEILKPDITYERDRRTDNFQAILDNVRQAAGTGGAAKPNQTSSSGKKLLIRDFLIKKGQVALYLPAGQAVTADLPEIHLQNIGGENKGIEPARAVQVIMAALYKEIRSPQVLNALATQLKQLNIHIDGLDVQSFSKKLQEDSKKLQEGAGGVAGALKGLLDNKQ